MMVGAARTRIVPDVIEQHHMINGTDTVVTIRPHGSIDFGREVTPLELTSTLTLGVGIFTVSAMGRHMLPIRVSVCARPLSNFGAGGGGGSGFIDRLKSKIRLQQAGKLEAGER